MNSSYINTLLKAYYCDQVIDEACNADMVFNNQFRKTLTIADCVNYCDRSKELKTSARGGV